LKLKYWHKKIQRGSMINEVKCKGHRGDPSGAISHKYLNLKKFLREIEVCLLSIPLDCGLIKKPTRIGLAFSHDRQVVFMK
jgi:hypothetical protein